MDSDHFRRDTPMSVYVWSTIVVLFFTILISGCYCCVIWQMRRRQLWSNVDVNPRPAGLWNNVDANPSRPTGLWGNVNANPSRPVRQWSNVNSNPSRPVGLWGNVNPNPSLPVGHYRDRDPISSRPILPSAPPVLQDDFRIPVGDSDGRVAAGVYDVPPDYSVVVDQRPMSTNGNDDSNRYPVVGARKSETPPPSYMTVAPFK